MASFLLYTIPTGMMSSSDKAVHTFFLFVGCGVLLFQSNDTTSVAANAATVCIVATSVVYDTSSYKQNIDWFSRRLNTRYMPSADAFTIVSLLAAFFVLVIFLRNPPSVLAVLPLLLCLVGQTLYLWSMYERDLRVAKQFNTNMNSTLIHDDYTDDADVQSMTRTYAASASPFNIGDE